MSVRGVNHADRLSALSGEYVGQRFQAERARNKLRAAVRAAIKDGMTEVEAAELAGVTRMTIRAWIGKGK